MMKTDFRNPLQSIAIPELHRQFGNLLKALESKMHWQPINVARRCLAVACRAQPMLSAKPRHLVPPSASTLQPPLIQRARCLLCSELPRNLRCGSGFQCVPTRRGRQRLTPGLHGREWGIPRRTVQAAPQFQLRVLTRAHGSRDSAGAIPQQLFQPPSSRQFRQRANPRHEGGPVLRAFRWGCQESNIFQLSL